MKSKQKLKNTLEESIKIKKRLLKLDKQIDLAINQIYKSIKLGGKILLCGNGGSAADAQHLAAEFTVRLRPHLNRKPIPALSLSSDASTLTACGNDYGFKKIFVSTDSENIAKVVRKFGKMADAWLNKYIDWLGYLLIIAIALFIWYEY